MIARFRRSPWLQLSVAAFATVLAACTLIVGHITIPMCTDATCNELNTQAGISPTACPRWWCSQVDRKCHNGPVDVDGDNHLDPACAGGDDCDDRVATAHPGGTETCDGADNDCNGVIDDGKLAGDVATIASAGTTSDTGRYSGGVPNLGEMTWTTPMATQSLKLVGAMSETAHAVTPETNANRKASNPTMDQLLGTQRVNTTNAPLEACLVTTTRGTVACVTDMDCLQDRGTCQMSGLCTGSATDPSTDPFTTNHSCLDAHPLPDGGTMGVPDDMHCRRLDVCARGFCELASRDDIDAAGCRLADTAIDDIDGTNSIVAAVDVQGCGHGALRLFGATGDLSHVMGLGPEYRSNVYTGVDPMPVTDFDAGVRDLGVVDMSMASGAIGRCTGFSRTDLRLGAARPSVAGLHGMRAGEPPQALVAFHARSYSQNLFPGTCGHETSPVSVLGAFVESTGITTMQVLSVMATNDGVPQDLGTTRGILPVGVASLGGQHYLAAFPDAAMSDQIAIFVIEPATPPSAFVALRLPDGGEPDASSLNPYALRTTMPLMIPAAPVIHIPTGPSPDGVVVAPGGITPTGATRIGVAWGEGCDDAAHGSIHFAIVDWTPTGTTMEYPPVTLSTGVASSYRPTILYVADGFLRVGAMRGSTAIAANNDGGWLVGFVGATPTGTRFFAARVSELDGTALEPPVDVAPPSSARIQSAGLYPYTGDARAAYASLDNGTNVIVGGTLLCTGVSPTAPDGGTM